MIFRTLLASFVFSVLSYADVVEPEGYQKTRVTGQWVVYTSQQRWLAPADYLVTIEDEKGKTLAYALLDSKGQFDFELPDGISTVRVRLHSQMQKKDHWGFSRNFKVIGDLKQGEKTYQFSTPLHSVIQNKINVIRDRRYNVLPGANIKPNGEFVASTPFVLLEHIQSASSVFEGRITGDWTFVWHPGSSKTYIDAKKRTAFLHEKDVSLKSMVQASTYLQLVHAGHWGFEQDDFLSYKNYDTESKADCAYLLALGEWAGLLAQKSPETALPNGVRINYESGADFFARGRNITGRLVAFFWDLSDSQNENLDQLTLSATLIWDLLFPRTVPSRKINNFNLLETTLTPLVDKNAFISTLKQNGIDITN